jgi:probable F420-dependent oxidoreductase
MRFGAVFPQTEIGSDPVAIRDWGQAVEELGYRHILIYDHVLGASTANRPDWRGPYTSETLFHEPFVLYGYFAALTRRVELVTDVLILPQRQTALVAKQAAEVDVLSGGRLRLGVGVGWNAVEYEALGEEFGNRGARSEEQIAVLRALWTAPVVTFTGRWRTVARRGRWTTTMSVAGRQRGGTGRPVPPRISNHGTGHVPWREAMRVLYIIQ